jgi:hypothetical protein
MHFLLAKHFFLWHNVFCGVPVGGGGMRTGIEKKKNRERKFNRKKGRSSFFRFFLYREI